MRSIKLKLTSIASFLSSKKVIWCRFIFERSVSREDNLLSSSLELMDHSKFSNALVKMPTRLNYQLSMRFQKHLKFLIFFLIMVKKALTTRGRVFFNLTGKTRNKGSSFGWVNFFRNVINKREGLSFFSM